MDTTENLETRLFRHSSGAQITGGSLAYGALHGAFRIEGSPTDGSILVQGYRFERTTDSTNRSASGGPYPWPRWDVSRTTIAELCEVVDREDHDPFDHAGLDGGHLFVAYDTEPNEPSRNVDTEERVYANVAYQRSYFEFPLSHLSCRVAEEGIYWFYGYNPDGPRAEELRV